MTRIILIVLKSRSITPPILSNLMYWINLVKLLALVTLVSLVTLVTLVTLKEIKIVI